MPRSWVKIFQGGTETDLPPSGAGTPVGKSKLSTSGVPVDAFDATTEESVIVTFLVPDEHTGLGTLKMDIYGCSATTTSGDAAILDVYTEFKTPGSSESVNSNNFDTTADSATMNFSTTAYSLQKVSISLTPSTTPEAGDIARFKISRRAADAGDTLTTDLYVTHYVIYEEI